VPTHWLDILSSAGQENLGKALVRLAHLAAAAERFQKVHRSPSAPALSANPAPGTTALGTGGPVQTEVSR